MRGVVGLSAYLPRGGKIKRRRGEFEKDGKMKVFLGHGGRDMLVPVRFSDLQKFGPLKAS